MVDQGGEVLNKQALNNAQWAKHNAQAAYKKAYEEGDADAMAEAQEELAKAVLAEQQCRKICTISAITICTTIIRHNNLKYKNHNLTLICKHGRI